MSVSALDNLEALIVSFRLSSSESLGSFLSSVFGSTFTRASNADLRFVPVSVEGEINFLSLNLTTLKE